MKLNSALVSTLILLPSLATAEPWDPEPTAQGPWTSARGDFNGDGRQDLAFGSPSMKGTGQVAIWFNDGSPRASAVEHMTDDAAGFEAEWNATYTIIEVGSVVLARTGLIVPNAALLGSSVTAGDFDHDGKDDLAFGIPGATVGGQVRAGAVVVVYGKDLGDPLVNPAVPPRHGAAVVLTQNSPGIASTSETQDWFGEVLTAGDLNCDQVDDLVIGTPREDYDVIRDSGMVHVLYGKPGAVLSGVGSSSLQRGQAPVSGAASADDHFGASVAVGVFAVSTYLGQRYCPSLAIGAPNEDFVYGGVARVNAGRVHLVTAPSYSQGGYFGGFLPISSGTEAVLDQATAGILDAPESGDTFGAAVGRAQGPQIDDLWIAAAGEDRDSCPDGSVHRQQHNGAGTLSCAGVRPDVLEMERGVVVEKGDEYGRWLQYIPSTFDPASAELLMVIHGTNRFASSEGDDYTGGRANAHRFMNYGGFIDAADARNMIVIIPEFEDWNFGNIAANVHGGYRALLGRDVRADAWIERIADRYRYSGLGDGTFNLFGHSAGAQFSIRYVLQRPSRVDQVIVESSGSMPRPTMPGESTEVWPAGYGVLDDDSTDWGPMYRAPDEVLAWLAAQTKPILIVAGGLEDEVHTNDVIDWMSDVDTAYGAHLMTYCEVFGTDHDSKNEHRSALMTLWPDLALLPSFQSALARPCLF